MECYIGTEGSVPIINPTLAKKLKEIDKKKFHLDQRYCLLNDFAIRPMLADLTNQNGLVHYAEYSKNDTNRIKRLSVYCDRPKNLGLWNAFLRIFGVRQEVMRIKFNGQMWTCQYYKSLYYLTAEKIRDFYYDHLKSYFDNHDMVIINGN
jgi:hypothetical protein